MVLDELQNNTYRRKSFDEISKLVASIKVYVHSGSAKKNDSNNIAVRNSSTKKHDSACEDPLNLSNDDLVNLFIEKGLYAQFILKKDDKMLYDLMLEKLDTYTLQSLSKKEMFLIKLSKSEHGLDFLWEIFISKKIKNDRLKVIFHEILILSDIKKYLNELNKNMKLLAKIVRISGYMSGLKVSIESITKRNLQDDISTDKVTSYLVNEKMDTHLLRFISKKDNFYEYMQNSLLKGNPDNVKNIFNSKDKLSLLSGTLEGKKMLSNVYDSIENKEGFRILLKPIFYIKKAQ